MNTSVDLSKNQLHPLIDNKLTLEGAMIKLEAPFCS